MRAVLWRTVPCSTPGGRRQSQAAVCADLHRADTPALTGLCERRCGNQPSTRPGGPEPRRLQHEQRRTDGHCRSIGDTREARVCVARSRRSAGARGRGEAHRGGLGGKCAVQTRVPFLPRPDSRRGQLREAGAATEGGPAPGALITSPSPAACRRGSPHCRAGSPSPVPAMAAPPLRPSPSHPDPISAAFSPFPGGH